MLGLLLATTVPTVPVDPTTIPSTVATSVPTTVPTSVPTTVPTVPGAPSPLNGTTVRVVWDHLGNNGYQTGTALIVATIAIVALINIKASLYVLVPVAIGAFWAGWLGWNTLTGNSNPLFTGDPPALGLWDIAFQSDMSFLAVVIVACAAAVLVWRKTVGGLGKIAIIVGVALGASFVYNIVLSVRAS
jgi:hypothetical protein